MWGSLRLAPIIHLLSVAHLIAQAMPLGKYTRPYSVLIAWSGLLAKLLRERVRVRARVRAGARECITFLSLFSCGLINVVNIFVGSVVSHGYLIRWRNRNVDRGELSLAQGRSGVGYGEKEEINQPDTSAATPSSRVRCFPEAAMTTS